MLPGASRYKRWEAFDAAAEQLPQVPLDMWTPIHSFVVQVPWMIWLMYEDRHRMRFAAVGSPSRTDAEPAQEETGGHVPACRHGCRRTSSRSADAVCVRARAWHRCLAARARAIPPAAEEQQQPLLRALRDAEQRTYLDYVCRWQDAMLSQARARGTRNQAALRTTTERDMAVAHRPVAVMLVRRHSSVVTNRRSIPHSSTSGNRQNTSTHLAKLDGSSPYSRAAAAVQLTRFLGFAALSPSTARQRSYGRSCSSILCPLD